MSDLSLNDFLGRFVVVAEPEPLRVADGVTAASAPRRTREIDLRRWFFDPEAFVYRRRAARVPGQTDLAVDGIAVGHLPLAAAARLLEFAGAHYDYSQRMYYAARGR